MSTDSNGAARRVMNAFGEESRIPYLNIDEGDVGVLLGFPILSLFLAEVLGLQSLAVPLIAAGFGFGAALIFVTPDHLSASQWLHTLVRYAKRPQITYNVSNRGQTETTRNEGGLANYTPFTPDERTQDLTNIERAWPGTSAIQRQDGVMEAFIEVHPGNMDFAMSGNWASLQHAASEFANKELDFPLKFHTTTRSFPVEKVIARTEERLQDDDVKSNPVFEELLREYRDRRPEEMDGTQQLHYYLGVEVNQLEVYDRFQYERTPAEKLTTIPFIGILFTPFVTRREDFSDAELRAKMFERLDERLSTVRSEFIQQADEWSARRLSTVELFVLCMDFWNGEEYDVDDASHVVREQPLVGEPTRREDET
ncbi:hypothetical protein AUR64_07905 [Haloprofundus marisrubri]|uniref:Uncharacterized protein n=1 Tax=Haloprofundus marisrubri TaxID=1514971 RepID=A0A0W1RD88_9EURY|nr:hypothetical protein [Haloprofundus marisrubri]KTG10585.1 hypothetical protein AUR64_07905 [Haloprofundus marisrubri]